VLPHSGTPTTLVRAQWTDPPYVSEELLDGLSGRLGADFTLVDVACQHMVPNAKPEATAKVIRDLLGAG
jgi:lipase